MCDYRFDLQFLLFVYSCYFEEDIHVPKSCRTKTMMNLMQVIFLLHWPICYQRVSIKQTWICLLYNIANSISPQSTDYCCTMDHFCFFWSNIVKVLLLFLFQWKNNIDSTNVSHKPIYIVQSYLYCRLKPLCTTVQKSKEWPEKYIFLFDTFPYLYMLVWPSILYNDSTHCTQSGSNTRCQLSVVWMGVVVIFHICLFINSGLTFLLQKTIVSPNPFKIKMKNSSIIEKLQVDASFNIRIFCEGNGETKPKLASHTMSQDVVNGQQESGVCHYCHPLFSGHWCLSCEHGGEKKGRACPWCHNWLRIMSWWDHGPPSFA